MNEQNGPNDLRAIAHQAMTDRGLEPDFPPDAIRQLNGIHGPAVERDGGIRSVTIAQDEKGQVIAKQMVETRT